MYTADEKNRWTRRSTTMCCGWPTYWYVRNPSHFSEKNVGFSYTTSCMRKKTQKNLPALKLLTLSVRPEATGAYRESKLGKQSWQRDISVLQGTTWKIFWDFFSVVIWKRFGKGSEMKTAFSCQSNAVFARGSDHRFQNEQFGITRVLSSPLPSRRQQTDAYQNQH